MTAGVEKPSTPPCPTERKNDLQDTTELAIITRRMSQEHVQAAANTSPETQPEQTAEHELYHAARLLLDIAGDGHEHITMNTNPAIPKKYITVHRPLTLADMRSHLQGRRTLGANLQHQDGTTRALCFDADDAHTWQRLQDTAMSLENQGYKPLLEPSPAQRGGHLWLIFSERVNAAAAYGQVVTVAPQLNEVPEYWPGRGNQKVRLPAGRYVTPTFAQWTNLEGAASRDLANPGAGDNNRLITLLSNFTPAELIPDAVPAIDPGRAEHPEPRAPQPYRHPATTEPDEQHRQKYGNHVMWVEWPSEQYLIDRFNEQHTIADLAAPERNGMINAGTIGRPERTASIGVTPDGQHFTDFGKGARRADGTQDGGDPFEFYIRSQNLEKSVALRTLGQALNREASRELLRAARAGEQPPAWVMEIITATGRAIYNQNAAQRGHPPLAEPEAGRGVGGFSVPELEQAQDQPEAIAIIQMDTVRPALPDNGELWQPEQKTMQPTISAGYEGDYPPPSRPCICCNVLAWQWAGDRYICVNPGHPSE